MVSGSHSSSGSSPHLHPVERYFLLSHDFASTEASIFYDDVCRSFWTSSYWIHFEFRPSWSSIVSLNFWGITSSSDVELPGSWQQRIRALLTLDLLLFTDSNPKRMQVHSYGKYWQTESRSIRALVVFVVVLGLADSANAFAILWTYLIQHKWVSKIQSSQWVLNSYLESRSSI